MPTGGSREAPSPLVVDRATEVAFNYDVGRALHTHLEKHVRPAVEQFKTAGKRWVDAGAGSVHRGAGERWAGQVDAAYQDLLTQSQLLSMSGDPRAVSVQFGRELLRLGKDALAQGGHRGFAAHGTEPGHAMAEAQQAVQVALDPDQLVAGIIAPVAQKHGIG